MATCILGSQTVLLFAYNKSCCRNIHSAGTDVRGIATYIKLFGQFCNFREVSRKFQTKMI